MEHKAAEVVNGVVQRVILSSIEFAQTLQTQGQWVDVTGSRIGKGFTYNSGEFRPPKPYDSWVWNDSENKWEAPKPYPNDGKDYYWNESQGDWIEFETSEP